MITILFWYNIWCTCSSNFRSFSFSFNFLISIWSSSIVMNRSFSRISLSTMVLLANYKSSINFVICSSLSKSKNISHSHTIHISSDTFYLFFFLSEFLAPLTFWLLSKKSVIFLIGGCSLVRCNWILFFGVLSNSLSWLPARFRRDFSWSFFWSLLSKFTSTSIAYNKFNNIRSIEFDALPLIDGNNAYSRLSLLFGLMDWKCYFYDADSESIKCLNCSVISILVTPLILASKPINLSYSSRVKSLMFTLIV